MQALRGADRGVDEVDEHEEHDADGADIDKGEVVGCAHRNDDVSTFVGCG